MRRTILAAALALSATAASAQGTYQTTPLGNGFSMTTGPNGYTANTSPLGNGFAITTDNQGNTFSTTPLGNGFYSTTVTGPAAPGLWAPMMGR